ncbi:Ppx/GppA family phosphatase [Siculibacillus lacustris]|uniref:Ppx/GppA family phosphatase n=1 Tax=Siculibacillus lacustris TaxID=1549641 RepID=A0A4Q9VPU3_9HYPH|nr:Ppx/GppA phosphatase family protein [Siculibacillus lacustris]TBW36961.1 Ppx/GppA family phosphatase [Siculibacillus lacustris]
MPRVRDAGSETLVSDPRAAGRLAGYGPVAVIDIGSNSVRLVVYERLTRSPTVVFNEKVLAGLGKGLSKTGHLAEASLRQALAAVKRFKHIADQAGAVSLHVLATAAAREAANGPPFVAELERICGVPISLLTGADEARLAALGIVSGMWQTDGVAGDLGGGSLELVDIRGDVIGEGLTYPLGGIRLSESADGSIRRAERIAQQVLETSPTLENLAGRSFYAVGGTWRSLAKLHMHQTDYPLHVMQNYAIPADEALELCRLVGRGAVDALPRIETISKQRRDLLPYGAVVLAQVIRAGRPKEIVLSALGLREGHLYELLDGTERARDPLIEAARELAFLRSRSPAHTAEMGPWTAGVFDAMGIDETVEEERLRLAACHLVDIGWRAHPDYRGEQSLNIIAHAAFIGVDHPGRAYLALANYYRHMGLIDDALSPRIGMLAPPRLRDRARALGAAFRVAFVLSAAMPGIVPTTTIERRGDFLVLDLPGRLADLDGEVLQRRFRQLARLAGLDVAIRTS